MVQTCIHIVRAQSQQVGTNDIAYILFEKSPLSQEHNTSGETKGMCPRRKLGMDILFTCILRQNVSLECTLLKERYLWLGKVVSRWINGFVRHTIASSRLNKLPPLINNNLIACNIKLMIYILALKPKVKKHSACYIWICLYKNQKQWLEPILAATAGAESIKQRKFSTKN